MKHTSLQLLGVIALTTLVGCSSTSLRLQEDSDSIAHRIGDEPNELLFVSQGHFTPAEEVSDFYRFTSDTHGLVALTEESLLWSIRSDTYAPNYTMQDIQIATIKGVSYHRGYLQLKIGEEVHVLRPTLSNPFKNTSGHTAELYQILLSRNVPELELENPFRPKARRPLRPLAADPGQNGNPSESYSEPVFTDKAHISDGNGGYYMGWKTFR